MASTIHLALGTTLAVHLIAAVVIDVLGVVNKHPPPPPPTRVSVVDLDTSRIVPPPEPDPIVAPVDPIVATTEPVAKTPVTDHRRTSARTTSTLVRQETKATAEPTTDAPAGGGRDPFRLPETGSDGHGPAIARGTRTIGPTGDGGNGGGSGGGSGDGVGSGSAPPKVFSLADIKTQAKPKGNYDYFDAGKNYPPEARQLGVEGVVKAKLIVDDHGRVTKVTLLRKLGHGLDELALARGRALEFDPALDAAGRAVASIVVWEFTFTLPK